MKLVNIFFIAVITIFWGCNTDFNRVPLIKTEHFFKNPDKISFQISPNGKHISYLASVNGKLNIFVKSTENDRTVKITNSTIRDIRKYFWVNDNKIVYGLDLIGNDNYQLFVVDIYTKQTSHLAGNSYSNIYLLSTLLTNNNELLIADNKVDKRTYDIYLLNINTGEQKQVLKNNGNITWFLPNNDKTIKIVSSTDGVNTGYYYRPSESAPFKMFIATGFEDDFKPVAFTQNENEIYALSNINRDKLALIKYNINEHKEIEKLYENNFVDIKNVLFSTYTNKLIGISLINQLPETIYFDKTYLKAAKEVKNVLENSNFEFESVDKAEDKFIVKTFSDRSVGEYYLYIKSKNKLTELSKISSEIDPENMAEMKPISFISRDGKSINGYLSLPPKIKPVNLPVIVMPHGGPWLRDEWGYNNNVQFLCNRGYAVLQVNYRGSKGYGKKFILDGFKQWGNKMQDDIADGTKWLIEQGIADPDRIGIYGFSFGGYSALMGVIRYPELYKCAVSYCGLVNLTTFISSIPPDWEPFKEMMYKMVGNPINDSIMLRNSSPYDLADRIKANVLIAQGANDPKIKVSEVDSFVEKLRNNKNEVSYIVYKDEGHGFTNENNRIEFYKKMESFLAKNLGGRKE